MVALVTGGGRGIGQAVALRLANEGWAVAVTARSANQLQDTVRQSPGEMIAVPADVSEPESVKEMVHRVEQELGPITLLVNNAGAAGPLGSFWENDPDDWWQCLEVNLRGPMLCCHRIVPGMMMRKSGRIINIASVAGCLALPDLSAYVTSKTALIRLSEQLALELEPYGVRVFSIHPGAVRTAMIEEARHIVPVVQQALDAKEVKPDVAADLIVFLVSGKADALSGRFFSVDEDVHEIVRRASDVRDKSLYMLRLQQQ
jgi:NAD(P)-dependent dehydrogenase (short-subunit alcohol dehydrogenase family)